MKEVFKTTFFCKSIVHIMLIIICGFFAYSNTFYAPFQFDDAMYITENPLIKNPSFLIKPSEYCSQVAPMSDEEFICLSFKIRYIGHLTFALNYLWHDYNVTGYHIVNFLIHSINALLLYLFVILSFRTPFLSTSKIKNYSKIIALFSSLLFVIHPLQTEAVSYIAQRFTSLATLFCLLSTIFYILWRLMQQDPENVAYIQQNKGEKQGISQSRHISVLFYIMSVIFSVSAMKTKEIAFTLPLIIVLYEFVFFNGRIKRRILYLIPFILTLLVIPLSLININGSLGNLIEDISETTRVETTLSRWDYLLSQLRVIITYLRLIFFPVNQNLDYDYPIYHSFFTPEVFLSFLLLLLIVIIGSYLLYRYRNTVPETRLISFGIFWFFITLSVESSIIPIIDVIFEHRMYLPSVGVFIAMITTVFFIADKFKNQYKAIERVVVIILTTAIVTLAGATFTRNTVWQNEIRLWEDVVSKSPEKARGFFALGKEYDRIKNFDKAVEMYRKAISLKPTYVEAYNNLADVLLKIGRYDEAQEFFNAALSLDSYSNRIYNNRGRLYLAVKQYDKAIEDFTKAIILNPQNARYYIYRGRAYALKGQFDNAIKDFTHAISINSDDPESFAFRGLAYSYVYSDTNAKLDFQKSCSMGYKKACDALGKYSR